MTRTLRTADVVAAQVFSVAGPRHAHSVRTLGTGAALVALAFVMARATTETVFDGASGVPLLGWTVVAWGLFALAWRGLCRAPQRSALVLVVVGTVMVAGAALSGPPNTSTDSARYAWDGIVTGSGVSPWAHPPASDALDDLREPWLYPAPLVAADGSVRCVGPRLTEVRSVPDGDLLCTTLNRPGVPTIYPPVAQGWFAAVRALVPTTTTWWPMQVGGAVLVVAITLLLMRLLASSGRDPRYAAWWGWCPFVASEAVTNSHVDVVGVALLLAATLLVKNASSAGSKRTSLVVGVLLGLSAAVKVTVGVVALPLVRHRPLLAAGAATVTVAAVYLPATLVSGWSVLGYLPGYLDEQGYQNGSGFVLTSLLLPGRWSVALAVVLLLAIAAVQWRWTDPDEPWTAQLVGGGAMLLVVSSPYPWYGLVLVPFIALTRRWEWFAVPLLMTAHLLVPQVAPLTAVVLLSLLVVAGATVARRRRARGATLRQSVVAA